jgi:spoIIIJ-associated protein
MIDDQSQATLEVIAPTVEEAIEKGLADLNLPREAVEVEVLDQGNRGLFGLGTRQARIRLIVLRAGAKAEKPALTQPPEHQPEETEEEPVVEDEHGTGAVPTEISDWEPTQPPSKDRALRVAQETVRDLLERMNVTADVSAVYKEPEDHGQRPTLWIDITGKDLSILIGRRTQTLQAMQYITSLIVGKELGQNVHLVIDVEGYRSRREAILKKMASTMAEQAIKTGRRQALEPMPANERRIIHIELRNYPGVTTESVGEEPNRKVTIVPHQTD